MRCVGCRKFTVIERIVDGMDVIENTSFDMERALYGSQGIIVRNCSFDGPADGESALKESGDIQVSHCFFNLRYPFWHDKKLRIEDSKMTELCRAALWYSSDIEIFDTKLYGIKALRECSRVKMQGCEICSSEFGWSVHQIEMKDCTVQSEYFMMRSDHLVFSDLRMKGKYSFQYIQDSVFEDCEFDTKDAFWHAKNVVVRNSVVKGEYLAWYCENVVFENCKIIGTQPLCYCKGLQLIDCEMVDTDLCFEKSEVEATVLSSVVSIKNPLAGHIYVESVGEMIWDDKDAHAEVVVKGKNNCA